MMPHRLTRRWHALIAMCLLGTLSSYAAAQSTTFGTSILSGWSYVDRNNDGVLSFLGEANPEIALPNIEIKLFSVTNGVESLLSTTLTDEFGRYYFNNLAAGAYSIRQTQPTSFIDGKDTVGTLRSMLPNGVVPNDASAGVASDNAFTGIVIPVNVQGDYYNFGELGLTAGAATKRNLLGSTPIPSTPVPPIHTVIPEPATLVMLISAFCGIGCIRRRRR